MIPISAWGGRVIGFALLIGAVASCGDCPCPDERAPLRDGRYRVDELLEYEREDLAGAKVTIEDDELVIEYESSNGSPAIVQYRILNRETFYR